MADSKLQDLNSGVGVVTLVDADFFYSEQTTTAKFCLASVMKTYMWLTPTLGGHLAGGGFDITKLGTLSMTEQAAANADVAGDGQMWVKTATPNQLWFTDDAGTDFQVANLAEAQTFTNKTLTAPIIATTGKIVDAGGDEYMVFTEATTPVTYIGITSGDTGVAPRVSAAGETNTDLHLLGSGTGNVVVSDGTDPTKDLFFELSGATTDKTMNVTSSHTDDRTLTLPDATDTLVGKATTDTLTNKTLTAPTINGGDYNGVALTTEEGSGWGGVAAYSSELTKMGKIIKTHIFIDIAGLVVSTTLLDIIGDSAAANSHGGQILTAECGVPIRGTITCLEAPTTGVADIDFYVSSASTGAENADVSALADPVVLLANTEAWTLGMTKAMALLPDATSDFIYLAAGDAGTPGTYGAGQFLIEVESYEA